MSVTVNLRNNTDFWVKVDGLVDTIAPNTLEDDRTHQWVSNENKQIKFFSNTNCEGAPVLTSNLTFQSGVGIKINRGNLDGAQVIKLDADSKGFRVLQEENGNEELLLESSLIDSECVVNLTFNK